MSLKAVYADLIRLYQSHHQEIFDHLLTVLNEIPEVVPSPQVKVGAAIAAETVKVIENVLESQANPMASQAASSSPSSAANVTPPPT